MKCLKLDDGRLSLEFAPDELPHVKAALSQIAGSSPYVIRKDATHDTVIIKNEELVFIDEWDEPCLISMSESGDTLVREIVLAASKIVSRSTHPTGKRGSALAA